MNIKQLERSQKIYSELKSLDAEIIEIEKIALLLVDGNAEVKLNLSVKDTTPKPEKIEIDEEGDIKPVQSGGLSFSILGSSMDMFQRIYGTPGYSTLGTTSQVTKDTGDMSSYDISESLSLNILAILLNEKLDKRTKLIKSLNRIGVTI